MNFTKLLLLISMVAMSGCAYMGVGSRPLSELTEKYTDESSKFLAVDDLVIHYRDEGTGPVVLLLHGETTSLHIWDAWAEKLKGDFRVIRMDLPGHGLTGPDQATETYDLDYMITKVEHFMDKLNLRKVQMVGNSLGGYITWNFAERYPQRVERMILVNSIGYQQELPSTLSYNTIPVLREFNALILSWSKAQHRVEEAYGDDEKITDDVIRRNQDLGLRKGNRSSLIKVARTIEKDTDQRDLGNRIKYIQTPTLVMWGEEDEWTPVSVMKHFKVDLPNMDIISYEGVGHLPMEELPRQSARDALHYLKTGEPGELPGNQEQGW